MDDKERYRSWNDINFDEQIVISGIAGRFPNSNNMNQLRENLFNKINLTRADHNRWKDEYTEVPSRIGIVKNIDKFDANFFGLSFDQVHVLSSEARMLMEHSYEAIIDAGINPKQLREKNTAVIIGTSFIETLLYSNIETSGFNIIGSYKSTMANMISYFLDLKGPSCIVDSACSSSLYALAVGYDLIMSGKCEDALIGAAHLCFNPIINQQFFRLGVLSSDGYCRPFDTNANGYARSETVAMIYLQKAKNAKRIYAICPHIKLNNDGYKEEGITYPSTLMQSTLLSEFYNEYRIPISCLDYFEAHGTGTKIGDPLEINAIYNVLCKNKETPLMIGSIKSNLGHGEPASGFNQIAKIIIAFETGSVPPNINYTSPRKDIDALINGNICVVTEPMPLKYGYISLNSFGFGGSNAHMLLKWNLKQKVNNGAPNDDLPRLVILSGSTEESVKSFLNDIANNPIDVEYIRLLHDIYADNISSHSWRGYIILNTVQKDSIKEIRNCEREKRPVWFIFSSLGSQWPGMGQNLLKFHVFAKAIRKCNDILKPYGINIIDILTKTEENMCENALNAFLGIIAIQIGLVDLLKSLGIIPDYMISHSGGELCCAYADECLTIEQTILSAYFIGLACSKVKIRSCMAIVSFDYEYLKNMCPSDIEIICRNSENSSIVCGPIESVQKFMKKLQVNNIYVKEIYCNVPYHSSYLRSIEAQLLFNLNKVIPQPIKRSPKWISTSIPHTEWVISASKLSSADYHTRSILSTVLFEQATYLISSNAITIEIAPNDVLQHILNVSLHPNVINVVLIQRTEQNIDAFLRGIGDLYNCGLQPQLASLYPPIEFPVSRGTPMISPSIRWDHSENWCVPYAQRPEYLQSKERCVEISLNDDDYDYMSGHIIDGKNLLPATGYLVLVWQTISIIKRLNMYLTMSIVFRDVNFIRSTHLSRNNAVKLIISIQTDGKFEITEGDSIVVTGTAYETSNPKQEMIPIDLLPKNNDEEEHMTAQDIYKELKLRGYQYSGLFRGLKSASVSGNKGHIIWNNNWVSFMDNMLQMHIIGYDTRDLYVPTSIQKLVIDPMLHFSKLWDNGNVKEATTEMNKQLSIQTYKKINMIKAGGIEIQGVKTTQISRRKLAQDVVIERYSFVAHCDHAKISLNETIRISAQLALEDHQISNVKIIELVEDVDDVELENLSSSLLIAAFNDIPLIRTNITLLTSPDRFNSKDVSQNFSIGDINKLSLNDEALIVAGFNLLSKRKPLKLLLPFLKEGGYLLTREKCNIIDYEKYLQQYELNIILEKRTDKEMIILLKKKVSIEKRIVVHINNDNFSWVENLKLIMSNENKLNKNSRIIIVGERDFECGLLGFVNCLRKEPGGEHIRGILIQDEEAPKFSLQEPFYVKQLQKDLTINVLRANEAWGSYRHFKLLRSEAKLVPTAHICQTVRGDLSTFCWIENNRSIESNYQDLVHIVYSSLNFKDVMLATGKLNQVTVSQVISEGRFFQYVPLGLEYVGLDANGQRVMGVHYTDCIANVIVKDKDFCWKIPDMWTFEEAATVSCVYSTVYLALYIHGKIKKGDKILIHSGAGGIGQAAIHLALKKECEVFTTVGTSDKRNFIRKMFPTISDEHIGNSRDTSFEQMIMRQTKGRGVDIVLNSLAEEKLIASVRCLAQNGRFLEIGKFDLGSNNVLDISVFQKGISFHGILLENMFLTNHKYRSLLSKMIADDLKNETIEPIQGNIFSKTDIERAFRYMMTGKHMGKVIINIHEKNEPLNEHILAHRRYYCRKDRNYIILGGLGGFGLELTDWLIFRGARNVVLISRTGIKNGYQRMRVQLWKSYGVNVLIIKNIDVADLKDCEYLLRTAEEKAPVDAIFNLGVVLKDGIFNNQTAQTFEESFKSKARATQTLDKLSRTICYNLRHFVVFSSVFCGRGNAGQTNYGMANSIMERVCEKRVKEGLPGLAIQWGAIGDVGLVADMQEDDKELIISGTLQQKISSCLEELDKFLLQSQPIVSSMVVAEKKHHGFENLVEVVANILNISDMKFINHNSSLAELGVDSMMIVEIKQILEREFDILLSAQEIRILTFAKLIKISKSKVSDNKKLEEFEELVDVNTEKTNILYTIKLLFDLLKNEDFIPQTNFDLSTKRQNSTSEVFLIPGIDGRKTVFNYLTSNIIFSTTFLHHDINNIDITKNIISQITDNLINHVLPKLKHGKDFIMVGYSFGSIIAIELTRKLEAMNFKGRLVLIDGAPEQLRTILNKYFTSNSNDVDIQIALLINILEVYSPKISEKVLIELKKCDTWDEKYNIFVKQFRQFATNTSLLPTNLKTLCTNIYKHLVAVQQYDPSTLIIKSPIMLLKPTKSLSIPEIKEDYCLHKITQNVEVRYFEGNHVTIMKNEKVAAAINGESSL